MTDIAVLSLISNLDRSQIQCNASSIYLEQTFVCRVDTQLTFENVKRNKRSILNVNLRKCPKQIQHPVKDLKMELLLTVIINFKPQTNFAKRSILDMSQVLSLALSTKNQTFFKNKKRAISWFFGMVTLTTQLGF